LIEETDFRGVQLLRDILKAKTFVECRKMQKHHKPHRNTEINAKITALPTTLEGKNEQNRREVIYKTSGAFPPCSEK
jgi:hypothetical protein